MGTFAAIEILAISFIARWVDLPIEQPSPRALNWRKLSVHKLGWRIMR